MHKVLAAAATVLFALSMPAFADNHKKGEMKDAKKAEMKKEEKKEDKKEEKKEEKKAKKIKGGC